MLLGGVTRVSKHLLLGDVSNKLKAVMHAHLAVMRIAVSAQHDPLTVPPASSFASIQDCAAFLMWIVCMCVAGVVYTVTVTLHHFSCGLFACVLLVLSIQSLSLCLDRPSDGGNGWLGEHPGVQELLQQVGPWLLGAYALVDM